MAANNIAQEDIAPLLDEKVQLDSMTDAAAKGPEVQVVVAKPVSCAGACVFSKVMDFLSHRSTYYWIALIAQFCHFTVTAIAYGFSAAYDQGPQNKIIYIISALFSWSPFVIILSLIRVQHKKSEEGPKRILAGQHYICARVCAMFNIFNFLYLLLKVIHSDNPLVFDDPVRPIVTPLAIGFIFVAAISCMKAARVTRLSATNARGTELVHDPEHRVPAWHLATMDESQSCRRPDGQVQLAV